MRFALTLGLALACAACDGEDKPDDTERAVGKAKMKVEELAALTAQLDADPSDTAKLQGDRASKALASLGGAAGDVPDSGGEVKAADEPIDIDDDGVPDTLTAVEHDDRFVWLAEASSFDAFACPTLMYFVTDKPPEEILAWGLLAEGCGAMACPAAQLEEEEPDFDACECSDPDGGTITCAALFQTLGGETCPDGTEGTPPDCVSTGDPTPASGYACADGQGVVALASLCDGSDDCGDGSDEACGVVVACGAGDEVVTPGSLCDGANDCSDGSDELVCSDGSYVCADAAESIPVDYVCDGEADCGDQSDEAVCGLVWACDDGLEVTDPGFVCDGEADCSDGSDEARCQ